MKKIFMALAVSAAFAASPASAQLYVGGGVGEAKTDSRETSFKVYGGFQFNSTWGLEVGYNDLGKYRGRDIESYTVAGTGTIPLNERWSVIGKVGAAENRPDVGGNRTALLLGIGVGYMLDKNMAVRLEYEDFGKLADAGSSPRGKNVGLSLKYSF